MSRHCAFVGLPSSESMRRKGRRNDGLCKIRDMREIDRERERERERDGSGRVFLHLAKMRPGLVMTIGPDEEKVER